MVKVLALVFGLYQQTDLVVETWSGDVFVAGSGDDCVEAFKGAQYPAEWRELRCEKSWRWGK